MKSIILLIVGAFIGSVASGIAVYSAVAKDKFEFGYHSGRTAAQVEIADQIGATLGRYKAEEKALKIDTLYQVKDVSVVVIEKDGLKSLRLWY